MREKWDYAIRCKEMSEAGGVEQYTNQIKAAAFNDGYQAGCEDSNSGRLLAYSVAITLFSLVEGYIILHKNKKEKKRQQAIKRKALLAEDKLSKEFSAKHRTNVQIKGNSTDSNTTNGEMEK